MYLPTRYASPSDAEIAEVVDRHPFATLITPTAHGLDVSHVPLLLEKRASGWVLSGHLARANDHWKSLAGATSTAIFHGPHTYVTPTWYERCDVPTWNYVVAHLSGEGRLLEREEDTVAALRALSARMEEPGGWRFEIPEDLARPGVLLKSIIGFELAVSVWAGKFKLSQNKSSTDQQGVRDGLATRDDEQSASVLAWMQRFAAEGSGSK